MKKAYISGKEPVVFKITKPHIEGIFVRDRLFDVIEKAREFPVLFVTSPPGSGKTILVSSYLESHKLPFIWYRVDEGDEDIATFFFYMGLAIKRAFPAKRFSLPIFSPEYTGSASVFSKRYFEHIFSRVAPPFMIVLDNFQAIPDDSQFQEILCHIFDEIPEGINITVISRKGVPASFAALQVNKRICPVDWSHIRFSYDEVKAFVTQKAGEISDEHIHFLYQKTDGWAAGLVLMLESLRKEKFAYTGLNHLSFGNIFDYFAHETFRELDKATRMFLLKTSCMHVLTADTADKLTGLGNSERILNNLNRNHYFTEIYPQERSVYYYHPLFREFLQSRAKEVFPHEEILGIKQHAAVLLEDSGRMEDAIGLFRESGDIEGIVRIIQKWAGTLVEQGRYQTLSNWLEYLPKDVLSDNPGILYWMGVCRLPFNPAESQIHFEVAFHKFNKRNKGPETFLSWAGVVDSIMYGHEGLKSLDRWFPVIDDLTKKYRNFHDDHVESGILCSLVRALSLRRPAKSRMEMWADRIQTFIQESRDVSVKISALTTLGCYFYSEGNFQKMNIVLESLHELIKRREVSPVTRLNVEWLKAAYFNVMSQHDECRRVVSGGLELAAALKIYVMESMLLGHGVLSSLKNEDFETAHEYLKRMAYELSFLKTWEASFYHYCSAWEALYRNNLAQALTHSEHCLRLCEHAGNPWTMSCAHLLAANVSFVFEEIKQAFCHIRQAFSIGKRSGNEFTPYICHLTEAYFLFKQGKEGLAIKAVRRGLKKGREKGFVSLFMSVKGVMETISSKALEHEIEVPYVKSLICSNRILPDTTSLENEHWPWPLKIFTLGRFGIQKNGSVLRFSGKVQQRPLAMLKALIAFGGREVPEDRIIDILWPESDGDAAHSAFTTTLHRLRQLLGVEQAVVFHEGKVFLDPRYCWVDTWAFERILGKVDASWDSVFSEGKKGDSNLIELAEKAVRMYSGAFLPGDRESWMISIRERLRNKYLRNISRLGMYWETTGKMEKAVECYHKGLEVDDLAEEFYQRLMKCYRRMGRRSEAIGVYKRCFQVLDSVLGIEPSPETEALIRPLMRKME
ncbi:MAG: BTAD domain-containing putative transcriptional regulator [Nitrospirota bacterium]